MGCCLEKGGFCGASTTHSVGLSAAMLNPQSYLTNCNPHMHSALSSWSVDWILQAAVDLFEMASKRDVRPATAISR